MVIQQMTDIAAGFSKEFAAYLTTGMPDRSPAEVQKIVDQIMPKTVTFCPALTAGELDDTPRLTAVALAIGLMYWGDQTMDRGSDTMPLAIQKFGNIPTEVPADKQALVEAQAKTLHGITHKVNQFALPDDAPYALDCFREQVLVREVIIHNLSKAYQQAANKTDFINDHAIELALNMTITAGLPSVSSSLYAIYRQHNDSLPSLSDVYTDETMLNLLQMSNAVVRLADELGDWEMDAGTNPAWGVFTINLFNQTTPALVDEFCTLALITDAAQRKDIHNAFANFTQDRKQHGEFLIDLFFSHARTYIENLPPESVQRFEQYILLCKRVLEIGYVNKVGDITLAGASTPQ